MVSEELIPHLFRTEFTKITAVLCKLFGIEHIELAEDIASETFLSALETWSYKGVPPNPVAWLYTVAKNKARNVLARDNTFRTKIQRQLKVLSENTETIEIDLSEKNITDSQLQMMFAICHPSIAPEAQIGLALRLLCGFGIEEIANAFLSNKETINKRLYRAKEKLQQQNVQIEFPSGKEVAGRLETVLTTLYLLFNEGYYSESQDTILREEFCVEAMRLNYLLVENKLTDQPNVNALLSLMCFHASRFEARKDAHGKPVLYNEQDETRWNTALIEKGIFFLNKASSGNIVSKYHLEASIAYWHTIKADTPEKWESILQLYNRLLLIEYSPVAALNRTFALYKVQGNEAAITEAEKLQLVHNQYYYSLLGELYKTVNPALAKQHFEKAYTLAKTQADKEIIKNKLALLQSLEGVNLPV